MKLKSLILFTLALVLITGCKKKKNEKLFVGTYQGEWQKEDTHYEFVDSLLAMVPYTVRDTSKGEFTITRDGNEAVINGHFHKIKLKDLEYDKAFAYASPTGAMGVAYSYSSWKLTLHENGEITWVGRNSLSEQYSSTYMTTFVGTKVE